MNPAKTYALVIGINEYAADENWRLKEAVNDADKFDKFLREEAKVPAENIINLRDEQATRKGILDGFKKLESINPKSDAKNRLAVRRDENVMGPMKLKTQVPAMDPTMDPTNANALATDPVMDSAMKPEMDPAPPKPKDQEDACIVIFYAGHGARSQKPPGWGEWAPDSTEVETLCPSDFGMPVAGQEANMTNRRLVEGIPDRTICWQLNRLSEFRGNNITLILDCCHSAGINRGPNPEPGMIYRRILNPPPLSGTADPEVQWKLTEAQEMDDESPELVRAMHQMHGFGGKFHESHVLLSACGKEQRAGDGRFTNALLKVLNNPNLRSRLTYTTLMTRVKITDKQTPHCEGHNINRILFTRQGPSSDPLFIPCQKVKIKENPTEQREPRWRIILDAGSAQGIAPGEQFEIYSSNITADNYPGIVELDNPNPRLGTLYAKHVLPACSVLKHGAGDKRFYKPTHFYAKRIDWSNNPPKLSCSSREWLDQVFPPDNQMLKVVRVENEHEASLVLGLRGNAVFFSRNDPFLEECQVPKTFPRSLPSANHDGVRTVVERIQHFNSHLNRQGETFPEVRMEMHFLEEIHPLTDEESQQPENFKPSGENLLNTETTVLKLPDPDKYEKPLGVTLYNDGPQDVYPYLFYFDPNDLTITPWYLVPIGAGGGKVDPPLRKNSKFCIGYGNGAVAPWSFIFTPGRAKDVGYFKLFLSTSPVNFHSLVRLVSPFDGQTRSDNPPHEIKGVDLTAKWGAKTFTVVQVLVK